MRLTKKQKILWNEAVRKTLNEVYLYDGIIPDDRERAVIFNNVIEKMSYKIEDHELIKKSTDAY